MTKSLSSGTFSWLKDVKMNHFAKLMEGLRSCIQALDAGVTGETREDVCSARQLRQNDAQLMVIGVYGNAAQ